MNLASRGLAPLRYARKSTHLGSDGNLPLSEAGNGVAADQQKSRLSQASAPSVSAISSVSTLLWASQ